MPGSPRTDRKARRGMMLGVAGTAAGTVLSLVGREYGDALAFALLLACFALVLFDLRRPQRWLDRLRIVVAGASALWIAVHLVHTFRTVIAV